jgi:hypothetical protein
LRGELPWTESTMNAKHEDLSPAEKEYLEHARTAESQGVPLSQYCRTAAVSVSSLYNIRRQLVKRGVLPRQRAVRKRISKKAFVAVRAKTPAGVSGGVCRLRSPSGWVVECASWPEPSWMKELTGEPT